MEAVLLGSQNATKLAKFYRETVGLKQTMEFEMGEKGEKGFAFEMKGASLYINDHSGVKGENKNPERLIINLEVDDIEKETKRLKSAKVKVKQDVYHIEGYGFVATFVDPDGNFFQFVQVRASN